MQKLQDMFQDVLRVGLVLFGLTATLHAEDRTALQIASPTVTLLYSFGGGTSDGKWPSSPLVMQSGILYGTTPAGGNAVWGTVFSLTPPASAGGAWTEQILHNFANGSDGGSPHAGLLVSKSGTLYGTTSSAGAYGVGTVYAMIPPSASGGSWTEQILYSFGGFRGDGWYPNALVESAGVLYGTCTGGGSAWGIVFSLTPPTTPGAPWSEQVLYEFTNGNDGGAPYSGVVVGAGGVLYGTTSSGGSGGNSCVLGCGVVYSLTPPAVASGTWTEQVLYNFTGGTFGNDPLTGLIIGSGGVLYGATYINGGVFSLTPPVQAGGSWTIRLLYPTTGILGGLTLGKNGVVFGTVTQGGSGMMGSIFALVPPSTTGGAWKQVSLYSFTGPFADGDYPAAALIHGKNGSLYGTTEYGGTSDSGTVFELKF